MSTINIRNITIIAHVDHGKTTLVDALLKQNNIFGEREEPGELIMDSNPLEKETGITIFWPDKGIDTGPVLLQKTSPVTEDDTVSSLYRNSLFPLGVEGLAEAVSLIRQGIAPSIIQDESFSTYEPPMEGHLASIQWMRPAKQIYDLVRGCDSQPGASANLNGELVRLLDASLERRVGPGNYGELIGIDEDGIRIALNGGTLLIRRIRPEGSRAIAAVEYAASVGLAVGHRFSV